MPESRNETAHAPPIGEQPDVAASQRSTPRRELVERQILDQAIRLFAERGFAGTSFQDVAQATGLTRPALYYYFASKDDLLARLVHEATDDIADVLDEIAADSAASACERLHRLVTVIALRQLKDSERLRVMVKSEAELPPKLAVAYDNGRRRVLRALRSAVEHGIATNEFRSVDARTAALGIIGMCNWVAWWHRPEDTGGNEAIAQQYAEFAVAGLAEPDSRAAEGVGVQHALALLKQDVGRLERALEEERPGS
jgi:AcrR family transcriptional regulator